MAKTSLKYGEPTWTSKLLVVGFSVAVAFMAGWLALAVVLGRGGSMIVATADEEVPAMTTKQPPRVETPRAAMSRPLVSSTQLLSPRRDPAGAPGAAATSTPGPQSAPAPAMALASVSSSAPQISAPDTVPAGQAATASLSTTDRVAVGDIYGQITNKIVEDDPADAAETIPLPPHRPRTAAVPFPRPRPQVHGDEQAQAQTAQPQTFIDFLTSGFR
jgi:hypothetical protein